MTPETEEAPKPVKAPARRKPKKRAKPQIKKAPPKDDFAGITAKDCPAACTAERCVISTVGVCHHPYKSAPNGAGPVTLANRDKARKRIKHQMVELKG